MAPEKIDLRRTKRRNNLLIIICLLALTALYLLQDHGNLVVTDITWQTEHNTCQVSFTLTNKLPEQVWTNITIKGLRLEKQGGGFRSQTVGERSLAIVLKGRERKSFSLSVPVSSPPDRVTVKLWTPSPP